MNPAKNSAQEQLLLQFCIDYFSTWTSLYRIALGNSEFPIFLFCDGCDSDNLSNSVERPEPMTHPEAQVT